METASYLWSIAVFLLILHILTHRFLHVLQNHPPTPFPTIPLIGHLYLLKRKKNVPFHIALSEVSRKYGPVLYLRFGVRPVLLVSSPSAAEECFTKNDIIFANRPPLLVGKLLSYNSTTLVWSSYGQHWRNLRRIATLKIFSASTIHRLSPIRVDEVRAMILRLFQNQPDHEKQHSERIVDIRTASYELGLNVMRRMIFGGERHNYGEIGEEKSEFAKMYLRVAAEISKEAVNSPVLDFMPFMRFFGYGKIEKKLMELNQKRDKLMQTLIDKCRSMGIDDDPAAKTDQQAQVRKGSMIQVLMELQATEPESYPDEIIKGLAMILYQASSDTTSTTMEWAFSLLLSHPEAMKKAKAEIDSVLGDNRLMDDSDVAQLPYLRCIIKETLRLHPPTPLLLPHYSSADCTVGGFRVPRGTILLVNVWAAHHDHSLWTDPEKFMPERFEGIEGTKEGFKFLPFGSGRRKCPGESMAIASIALALGSLLQCFDWEAVTSQEIDMSQGSGFVARKVQPLMAKYYPRPNMVSLLSRS